MVVRRAVSPSNGGFGKKDGYIDRGERVDTADTDTVDTAVT